MHQQRHHQHQARAAGRSARRTGRLARSGTVAGTVAAVVVSTALAAATPAQAATVRTFDDEAIGSVPSSRVQGQVTVQNVPSGMTGGRAAQVLDNSSSLQSRLFFLQGAIPARRYDFDYLSRSGNQGSIFVLHGSGASENTGAWRFLIAPAAAGSTTGNISAYNGSSWVFLGSVPGLRDPNRWSHITIDGNATRVSITARGTTFTTAVKAAVARDVTSLEIASSGTGGTGNNDYIDNLSIQNTGWVVATEPSGTSPRFPDIVKLKDGRLLAVYQAAAAHTGTAANSSSIKLTFSSNGGQSWTAPTTAANTAWDDRDPKVSVLADGTVLLNWFVDYWTSSTAYTNKGLYTARLTPGASSFTAPAHVATGTGTGFSHGPTVQLPDGQVLLPYYNGGVRLIRSTDGGVSWNTASDTLVLASNSSKLYMEPNISRLPSGQLVMLVRTADATTRKEINSVLGRSSDNGSSWTFETTGFVTSSHHQLSTTSGALLLTFGDARVANRPTYGALIDNPAAAWSPSTSPATLLYDSRINDQGNPSSVKTSPGVFLTLGYNISTRQLLAFQTTTASY